MTIGKGAVVRDSIIMQDVQVGDGCVIDKAIIAENAEIGKNCTIGIGKEVPNKLKPSVYSYGLVTIGKNTAISGITEKFDYPNNLLESGETLIKAGERI